MLVFARQTWGAKGYAPGEARSAHPVFAGDAVPRLAASVNASAMLARQQQYIVWRANAAHTKLLKRLPVFQDNTGVYQRRLYVVRQRSSSSRCSHGTQTDINIFQQATTAAPDLGAPRRWSHTQSTTTPVDLRLLDPHATFTTVLLSRDALKHRPAAPRYWLPGPCRPPPHGWPATASAMSSRTSRRATVASPFGKVDRSATSSAARCPPGKLLEDTLGCGIKL